jgi:hypothetical protein
MMTIRSISRALTVAAFVLVGNSCFALIPAHALHKINHNKWTIGAIAFETALPEDKDAAKAIVDTFGVSMDLSNSKPTSDSDASKINSELLVVNFVANYAARKAVRCLAANGMELPNPNLGNAANHVIKPTVEALKAATPQIVATLVTMALVK